MSEQNDESMKGLEQLAQHYDQLDEAPTPPPLDSAMRSALRFLPPFFRELAEKGVSFRMEGLSGIFYVDGFYKNGPMKLLVKDNDDIVATDKNGKEVLLKNYDDLMRLNFKWWRRSSTRNTYVMPNKPWINDFIQEHLVERKVIYVAIEENDESEADEAE